MAVNNDGNDDESSVTIGTPFDIVEENEPLKKPTKIEDQIATDQKGRRRFHGAFTGGFSAGYFNTVGSKEGWTPSTFKSSRSNRHGKDENTFSRPEDFMDDEDFADHGIAPRKLKATNTFESNEQDFSKKKRHFESMINDGEIKSAIPGGIPLDNLLAPSKLSIGMNLLKKMGWKPGQGVGEKTRLKDGQNTQKKIYGCSLPTENDSLDMSTLMSMLAPKDTQPYLISHKDNTHGLGYSSIDPTTALFGGKLSETSFKPSGKEKKGIKGQAFGVGVFEDEDDDIYASEMLSNYDLTMDDDNEREMHYGWGGAPKNQQHKNCLAGFIKSSKQVKPSKNTQMIELPTNYIPKHVFLHDNEESKNKNNDKKGKLTSSDRSLLIGEREKTLKDVNQWSLKWDKPKSPDSEKEKEKHDTKEEKRKSRWDNQLPQERPRPTQPPPTTVSTATTSTVTTHKFSQSTYDPRSGVFKPFINFPGKQQRYEKYLEIVKKKENPDILYDRSFTEWERQRELDEFARASVLYRPLSNAISSRFTRATITTTENNTENNPDTEKPDDVKAAKLGMYGKLTRTIAEWYPDKILCKRFNIPDPYPSSNLRGVPSRSKKTNSIFTTDFANIEQKMIENSEEKDTEDNIEKIIKTNKNIKNKTKINFGPLSFLNQKQPEKVKDNTILITESVEISNPEADLELENRKSDKPSLDIFKAIFDTDSSDSESDEDERDNKTEPEKSSENLEEVSKNIKEDKKTTEIFDDNKYGNKVTVNRNNNTGPLSFLNDSSHFLSKQDKNSDANKANPDLNLSKQLERNDIKEKSLRGNSESIISKSDRDKGLEIQNSFNKPEKKEVLNNGTRETQDCIGKTLEQQNSDYKVHEKQKIIDKSREKHNNFDDTDNSREKRKITNKNRDNTRENFKHAVSSSEHSDEWEESSKHKKSSKKHKSKHKKDKKHKKKKEKKKRKKEYSSSETESEEESLVPSNTLLLEKLIKYSTSKRPSAADFM